MNGIGVGSKDIERAVAIASGFGYAILGSILQGWGAIGGVALEILGFFIDNDFIFNAGRDIFNSGFAAWLVGQGARTNFIGHWGLMDFNKSFLDRLEAIGINITAFPQFE